MEPVSVGLLKEYVYCPVSAWLVYNGVAGTPVTPSMKAGSEIDLESIARRLGLPEPILTEKTLVLEEEGLVGKPDIIAGSRWRVVVEVKRFRRDPARAGHFRIQALAYAYLVQCVMGRVRNVVLVMGDDAERMHYTQHEHEFVQKLLGKMRNALTKPEPPLPPGDGRCVTCTLRRACPWAEEPISLKTHFNHPTANACSCIIL